MPRRKLPDTEVLQVVGLRVPPVIQERYKKLPVKQKKAALEAARQGFESVVNAFCANEMLLAGEIERKELSFSLTQR